MDTVSRKHLLAQAAALMGGATVLDGVDRAQAAPAELPVYRLDNLGGAHNAGCASCNACTAHAEHKYFASAADADLDRAHPYCKCRVIEGRDLPYAEWVALFGMPGSIARGSVDDRTPWVAEVLDSTPPPPGPEHHPPLHVRVLRARVQGRLIAIDLKLTQAARIEVNNCIARPAVRSLTGGCAPPAASAARAFASPMALPQAAVTSCSSCTPPADTGPAAASPATSTSPEVSQT